VALWTAWFVTHLPWLELKEQVALPLTVGTWALALGVVGWSVGLARVGGVGLVGRGGAGGAGAGGGGLGAMAGVVVAGSGAGLLSALIGLLVLGSKLTEAPAHTFDDGTVAVTVKPSAGLIAAGFLMLGVVLGLMAGVLGALVRGVRAEADGPARRAPWLARMGVVACFAAAPLLFVGGLVTSTNAGMAVPDWPNTYGTNMFLYPLGPRAQAVMGENYAEIYLEHTHRLFGTLLGMTMLTLMGWTVLARRAGRGAGAGGTGVDGREPVSRAAMLWSVGAFVGVVFQGLLGGARVIFGSEVFAEDSHGLRMFHGVSAQVVFAALVVTAVMLSPAYRGVWGRDGDGVGRSEYNWKRARVLCTACLHALVLQLVLGAAYRHFRHEHILYTHIVFALAVVLIAVIAGGMAGGSPREAGGLSRGLRTAGTLVGVVGIVQFVLGWLAWLLGGEGYDPAEIYQALFRTAHQANGAALLAFATWAAVASRALARRARLEAETR
jgi:cytochrome c oxidase assembly protein subunit 15